jgi:hypothetical protein
LLVLILGLSMAGGALFVLASADRFTWGSQDDRQGGGGRPGEIDDASRAQLEHVLRKADRTPGVSAGREKADR